MDTYKLTPKAKQALSISKKEAQLLRNKYSGTEHLLLGLLNIGDSIITNILEDLDVDLDQLRNIVYDNISQQGNDPVSIESICYTPRVEKVIEVADECARRLNKTHIDVEHILLGLLYEADGVANNILQSLGVDYNHVRNQITNELGNIDESIEDEPLSNKQYATNDNSISKLKNLQKHGIDLTNLAARGKIDPVIGREEEISRMIQVLCRKRKNNPVLIGSAGVGKTAVVEGLAQRIVSGRVPETLASKHIISIDLVSILAGTKYRGQFEEKLKNILDEIKRSKNVIVFIDEIHMIVGAGSAEGSMDAGNILKPALARGELRCIGATTPDEYRESIEKDNALERRFQPVRVEEPNEEDSFAILSGIKESYEKFHNCKYSDDALKAAISLSVRYMTTRNLPDKAIDIIDEVGARTHTVTKDLEEIKSLRNQIEKLTQKKENLVKGQQFEEAARLLQEEKKIRERLNSMITSSKKKKKPAVKLDVEDVEQVVSNITGVPITSSEKDNAKRILGLRDNLESAVIGQSGAVECISDSLTRSAARIQSPKKPIGSFLFLGTTGVGKTYLAKRLAHEMFDNEDHIVQIDMSELMEGHSVSKLIGSPPGYIGYNKGGKLTEAIRRNPYSVVLFDEIEKAHPDVIHILLQILEEGKVTDGLGRKVNFRNCIIIMTTNLGAEKIEQPVPIGFVSPDDDEKQELRVTEALNEVKNNFKAEFINRIDEIVVFNSMSKDNVEQVIDLQFSEYIDRVKEQHNITVSLDKTAKTVFLEQGYSEKYGVRELKRTIQRLFETKFAVALLKGKFKDGDKLTCYAKQGEICFRKSNRGKR